MNLRIVSWNVRGLNEQDKKLRVRNLIRKWKADIVCLQETKMELINRGTICSLWGGSTCGLALFRFGGCLWWDFVDVEQ